MSQITSFLGEHFFLSNFYHYKPFIHDSCLWRTSEHTFQAIKCSDYTNWLDACEEGYDSHEAMEANSIWKAATPQEDLDFAYFSFTIGMCFQTSDVTITERGIRRTTLVHGVLSFVYNTAILALALNLVFGRLG